MDKESGLERSLKIFKLGGDVAGSYELTNHISGNLLREVDSGNYVIPVISAAKSKDIADLVKEESGYDFAAEKNKAKASVTDLLLGFGDIIASIRNTVIGSADLSLAIEKYMEIMKDVHYNLIRELEISDVRILVPTDDPARFRTKDGSLGRIKPFRYNTRECSVLEAINKELNVIKGRIRASYELEHRPQYFDDLAYRGDFLAAIIFSGLLNKKYSLSGSKWENAPMSSIPLSGRDIALMTDSRFGDANIIDFPTKKAGKYTRRILLDLLKGRKTPVVAGFGGITEDRESSNGEKKYLKTTIGRNGTDTTHTFLRRVLDPILDVNNLGITSIDGILLKETGGCLTADPNGDLDKQRAIYSDAMTIKELPYQIAVSTGNLQRKAVKELVRGNLTVRVQDYKNPDLFTIIGPFRGKDRLYTVGNPKKVYLINITGADNFPGTFDKIPRIIAELGINYVNSSHGESMTTILIDKIEKDRFEKMKELLNREKYEIGGVKSGRQAGNEYEEAFLIAAYGNPTFKLMRSFNDIVVRHVGEENLLWSATYIKGRHQLNAVVPLIFDPHIITGDIHKNLVLPYTK